MPLCFLMLGYVQCVGSSSKIEGGFVTFMETAIK